MFEVHTACILYGAADHAGSTRYFLPTRRQPVVSEPAGHMRASRCSSCSHLPHLQTSRGVMWPCWFPLQLNRSVIHFLHPPFPLQRVTHLCSLSARPYTLQECSHLYHMQFCFSENVFFFLDSRLIFFFYFIVFYCFTVFLMCYQVLLLDFFFFLLHLCHPSVSVWKDFFHQLWGQQNSIWSEKKKK